MWIELDEKNIIDLYLINKKSILEISKILNVSHGTIRKRLIKNNIKLRTHSENQKIIMNRAEVKSKISESSIRSCKKRIMTNLKKYNVEVPSNNKEIKEKWINKHILKYGVKWPNQRFDIREKYKNTCIDKYGVDNVSKINDTKKKISINRWKNKSIYELNLINNKKKQTLLNRLGVDNPLKSKVVKNKLIINNINNYGVKWCSQRIEVKDKINKTRIKNRLPIIYNKLKFMNLELLSEFNTVKESVILQCLVCNNIFKSILDYIFHGYGLCPYCHKNNRSNGEIELSEYIKSFNLKIINNSKNVIYPYEIDIYVPDKNIAIEFNGIYYHSDKFIDKYYHLNKTVKCLNNNIKLIHIFEDEWINDNITIKNKIKNIFEMDDLYYNYNIEEYNYNDFIVLKLFNDHNICKSIIKILKLSNYNFEISCYDYNKQAFSLFLQYFINKYNYNNIFYNMDRRWETDDKKYYDLNFKLYEIIGPKTYYINGMNRLHESNNGKYKIYDVGHYKFVLKNH